MATETNRQRALRLAREAGMSPGIAEGSSRGPFWLAKASTIERLISLARAEAFEEAAAIIKEANNLGPLTVFYALECAASEERDAK